MAFRAMASIMVLFLSGLVVGCATHQPAVPAPATDAMGRPALAGDLNETAFKAALVGEWVSAWHASNESSYTKRLTFDSSGQANVTLIEGEAERTVKGAYTVAFTYPPRPGYTTLAVATIALSEGKPLVLGMRFGPPGSAIVTSHRIVLYINESVAGGSVLARAPATDAMGRPALAEDLDETAFKAALVGEWVSAWHRPNYNNYIKHLSLDSDGQASVEFVRDGTELAVKGAYSVRVWARPNTITNAEIRVSPSDGEPLVLSRVNFGLHNAASSADGQPLLLRIDKSPIGFGVLRRAPGK